MKKTKKEPRGGASSAPGKASHSLIDELNERCWQSMFDDLDAAQGLARSTLQQAEDAQYLPGMAHASLNIGWCAIYLGRSEEARTAFEKALELFTALNDPEGRTKSLNALGVMYHSTSRYERALDCYTQSLEEARRHGFRDREAATLSNIGEVCADLGNHKEALDYFLKAYDIVPEDRNTELKANILLNVGKTFVRMENYVLADEFIRRSLEIALAGNERVLEASCKAVLGRIERAQGNLEEAEALFRESLAISEGVKSKREIIMALLDLGTLLLDKGDLSAALSSLERAAATSEEIHAKSLFFSAYEKLAETHERMGNHKIALDFFRRYIRYEREIQNEDTTRKIKDIQIQFEVERTQREAEIYRLHNIELKEKTERLEEMNQQIMTISEIGQRITSSLDMETVTSTLYERLTSLMPTDVFAIALYDAEAESLHYATYILEGTCIDRSALPLDPKRSFAHWCIHHNAPVFVKDIDAEYRNYLEGEPLYFETKQRGVSFVFLPLSIENKVIGVLSVQSFRKEAYTDRDLRFLQALAPFVAIAVENSLIHVREGELNKELQREKEQLERATHQISYLANHDSLTSLPNRRLLFELLRKSFEFARRSGTKVGIIYVDLDDFKPINDRYGHLAGDRALVEIAERLQSVLRASDTVARVGGDEFVAVLNNVHSRSDVESAARKVLEICDAPLEFLKEPCRIGTSMGIAIYPDDGESLEDLIHYADSAMYTIKRSSKKGYAFYKKTGSQKTAY